MTRKPALDEALAELGKVQTLDGREKSIERGARAAPSKAAVLGDLGLRAAQA